MLIKGGYTVSFIKSVRMKTQKYFAMVGIWLAVTVGITQNGHKHLILTVVSQLRISNGAGFVKKTRNNQSGSTNIIDNSNNDNDSGSSNNHSGNNLSSNWSNKSVLLV